MRFATIDEAAHAWVQEFSAFPYSMIEQLMSDHPDDWREVTEPSVGDRVYVYSFPDGYDGKEHSGEITNSLPDADVWQIELDDGTTIEIGKDDFDVEYDGSLPMWGTLWQFGDTCDHWWLEEGDGIRVMSECGFRIYEHEEWGYFFGIDGAGYSFYEAHWIPLYKARGLKWADEQYEQEEVI